MTNKWKQRIYSSLFLLGMVLMVWGIVIYRVTIIEVKLLLTIIGSVGALALVLDVRRFMRVHNERGIKLIFYVLVYYTVAFGFTVNALFVLSNYYGAYGTPVEKTFEIVKRSSLPGAKHRRDERKPTFYIDYNGKLKELVFPHRYYEHREGYTHVILHIKKGYWGYDILENKTLIPPYTTDQNLTR